MGGEGATPRQNKFAVLRINISKVLDLGDPELGPYHLTEEEHDWMERMTKIMLTSLDGYRNWPIDSSDL